MSVALGTGDYWRLRRHIPLTFVSMALIVDLVALPGLAPSPMMPHLTLAAIFFWSLLRPDLINNLVIFLIGMVHDLIAGLPLGMTSLTMLLAIKALAASDREFIAGSFVAMWGCFILVAVLLFTLRWLLASLWWAYFFSFEAAMIEAAMTIAIFPFVCWLGFRLEPLIPRAWHASGE